MKKQPIVFDVDGTLTSDPYDESNLGTLRENRAMVLVALAMQLERPLIIATARSERFRNVTEKWLGDLGLNPTEVYMRPESKENVYPSFVKLDYLRDIEKKYGTPLLWADDNAATVKMLRKHNVPVIHVSAER